MLLANVEESLLRRLLQYYFRRFRYQSLNLAHNLSLLQFLHRFIYSKLRCSSDNTLLQSNASRNKEFRFCILF